MITVTASEGARRFADLLASAERGESVRFQKHGRTVARLVPDADFMDGSEAARLFARWRETATGESIADELADIRAKMREEEQHALADRR